MFKLLGKGVSHSFSKDIYNKLGYDYDILDLNLSEFKSFIKGKDFLGLNITMPYKEVVIKYLDETDEIVKRIGAVNTVINKDNKLYGYNTDYYGLKYLILNNNINIENKKVLILGTGGTAKTAEVVLENLKAYKIKKVSRKKSANNLTYDQLNEVLDYDIIINTTPIAMYPNLDDSLIDLNIFKKIEAVIDVIYNPLATNLILQAKSLNIKAVGGLEMLVGQAIYSAKLFFDQDYDDKVINKMYKEILLSKNNIVLIGMPTAGKTSIGKLLAKALNKDFIDTDTYIEKLSNKKIVDIIKDEGIDYFRNLESMTINKLKTLNNTVIATGGGSILNKDNVKAFKHNGILIFIDRPLKLLKATDNRPLSSNKKDLERLYKDRYNIYREVSDLMIVNDLELDVVVKRVVESIK